MEDDGGQTVIGNWTDQTEFVTWELVLAESGTDSVEIRYACPEESAGSHYRVGMQGAIELRAAVWNTGAWASQSPWLALGRLHLRAGRSSLMVRAIDKAGHAVMNLSGVRLVPQESAA